MQGQAGWKGGFPCLCCHLAQRAVHVLGFRGCSSGLGFIQDTRNSHPQEATQKKSDAHTYSVFQQPGHSFQIRLSAVGTSFAAMIHPRCMCCFPLLCDCYMCSQDLLCQQVDQLIEVKIGVNVPKHGKISLSYYYNK